MPPSGNNRAFLVYLALQYNPVIFFLIASNGGLGVSGWRLFWAHLVSASFVGWASLGDFKFGLRHVVFVLTGAVCIFAAMTLSAIVSGDIPDLAFYLVFTEFLLAYLVVVFYASPTLTSDLLRARKWILLFAFANFFIWAESLVSFDSWGVFRAYIGGITINRLPDFVTPLVLPAIFLSSGLIASLAVIVYLAATSYRTLYLGFILAVLALLVMRKGVSLRQIKSIGVISVILFLVFVLVPETQVILDRVLSLFLPEAEVEGEFSKSQRITDFFTLAHNLDYCMPLGCGATDHIQNAPLYNFAFFPLWAIVGMGIFSFPFLVWLVFPLWFLVGQKDAMLLGIYVMLICILCFFPYVHYFPLMAVCALLTHVIVEGRKWPAP